MKDLYGKKEKHDHKFSNILKGCILAIVMLAPFFAILSKMIYVSANKNAKDSYYGETINQEQVEYENIESLKKGQKYIYNLTYQTIIDNNTGGNNIKIYVNNFTIGETENNEIDSIGFWFASTYTAIVGYNTQGQNVYSSSSLNTTFTFIVRQTQQITGTGVYNENINFSYIIYNNYSYLDNVFYYAIDQSKNEEILKWTKDTPIYNVINTMNTGLGLSNNHILTYLLTYWSIILAIYIVFDIIIFVFTKITHYLQ